MHCIAAQVRIMNIDNFLNSKRLFRTIRYEQRFINHVPVMVHVNYHPDKWERMQVRSCAQFSFFFTQFSSYGYMLQLSP